MKISLLTLVFVSLFTQTQLHASKGETLGDLFLLTLPTFSYGSTFYFHDKTGRTMFYKSFASNLTATLLLKYSINKKRPNGDNYAFPSGHSSITFQSASFLHFRYGIKYAFLPYLGAFYTAYSRVEAKQHDTTDVIAGALLGCLSSYIFTKSYKGWHLQTSIEVHKKNYTLLLTHPL